MIRPLRRFRGRRPQVIYAPLPLIYPETPFRVKALVVGIHSELIGPCTVRVDGHLVVKTLRDIHSQAIGHVDGIQYYIEDLPPHGLPRARAVAPSVKPPG